MFFQTNCLLCYYRFEECLHAKPYKRGSYYVWSSYEELKMECFAYLPCDDNSDLYDNYRHVDEERHTGSCHNGFKVAVFDEINDYSRFMRNNVTQVQKEIMAESLRTRSKEFMSAPKKAAQCLSMFPSEHEVLANGLEKRFLQTEVAKMPEATTPEVKIPEVKTPEVETPENDNDGKKVAKESSDVVFFGYRFEYENFLMIMLACSLIIPSIVFGIVVGVLKIQRALNKYVFIKGNMSDLQ